ncbi:hypothetical protein ABIE18_002165 [Arthrobacter sp. 2762]
MRTTSLGTVDWTDPLHKGFPDHETFERELSVMAMGYLNHWASASPQPPSISTTEQLFQ